MALIEIDGLPNLKMVDLSMANCECHNQRVILYSFGFVWDYNTQEILWPSSSATIPWYPYDLDVGG